MQQPATLEVMTLGSLVPDLAPSQEEVKESADYFRIMALPRRSDVHQLKNGTWLPSFAKQDPKAMARAVSETYRRIQCTRKNPCDFCFVTTARELKVPIEKAKENFRHTGFIVEGAFNSIQTQALMEGARARGMVALVKVGGGKTLLSLCMPQALRVFTTLLLVPPQLLKGQFKTDVALYGQHFDFGVDVMVVQGAQATVIYRTARRMKTEPGKPDAPRLIVCSHQYVSDPRNDKFIATLKPDALGIDESGAFVSRSSARSKRVWGYCRQNKHVAGFFMSGTQLQRSVLDLHNVMGYALRDRSPLPLNYNTLKDWAGALDPPRMPGEKPKPPGVLMNFCLPGTLEPVRSGWQRRAADTVGVVISTGEDDVGATLMFYKRELMMSPRVQAAMDKLRNDWTRPDGMKFTTPVEVQKCMREMAAGFWYRWDWNHAKPCSVCKAKGPSRPCVHDTEWREAKAEWQTALRDRLSMGLQGESSPLLCERAAESGKWQTPAYARWRQVAQLDLPPPTVGVDVDPFLWIDAAKWGQENKGIIWYRHDHVGRRIAEIGGFPLYDATKDPIHEKGDRTVVCSITAHGVGKNLQHAFSKNLLAEQPAGNSRMEQVVGRTHRQGQPSEEVGFWVYQHSSAYVNALAAARRQADFVQTTSGVPAKLNAATFAFELAAPTENVFMLDALALSD